MSHTDEGLPCLNCGKPAGAEAKLFAEVFLCAACHTQAEHFLTRLTRELNSLLVLAKDAIRVALIEGKFSFPEAAAGQEVSKRDVLEAILQLEERRNR